jgi:hypothetical protein
LFRRKYFCKLWLIRRHWYFRFKLFLISWCLYSCLSFLYGRLCRDLFFSFKILGYLLLPRNCKCVFQVFHLRLVGTMKFIIIVIIIKILYIDNLKGDLDFKSLILTRTLRDFVAKHSWLFQICKNRSNDFFLFFFCQHIYDNRQLF